MGNTPNQKRIKELRGTPRKKKRKKERPVDHRKSPIISEASPVKITKADGTIEVQEALKPTKLPAKLYPTPRARNIS